MGDDEMSGSPILEIRNLTKIYADDTDRKAVLENVSLSIEENEFLCILGPSGCGKSTLLRCIAGFEPYTGDVLLRGEKHSKPGIDRFMVFQDFNQLFPWKTVENNVRYPLKCQGGRSREEIREQAADALKKVKLDGYEKYYPFQLSGGMKQRVAIAKALALKSPIILMDEPFAALDAMTRSGLQKELLQISRQEQTTIIFITHNIQEAIILGTRILVFGQKGTILVDEKNTIPKPVTPASEGYGKLWERFQRALYSGVKP